MNSWELNNNILKLYRNHKQSTNSTLNFHGGAVTSWKVFNEEQLFIKDESKFDNINPILGGIHVVFPNFNMDQIYMPNNGFARFCEWKLPKEPYVFNNNIAVEIELRDNVVMKALHWNHHFHMTFNIILGLTTLTSIVGVNNPSRNTSISFNIAIETFLRLSSIDQSQIFGLTGCEYIDKVNCETNVNKETPLVIKENVDRIYRNVNNQIFIHDLPERRKIKMSKLNLPDIFVLNPWIDEYKQSICIASGFISHMTTLGPNSWFHAAQRLEITKL